jgi:hypothetical protein
MSSPSWAKTTLSEAVVALRRLIVPPEVWEKVLTSQWPTRSLSMINGLFDL